jgi:hypothetical protein
MKRSPGAGKAVKAERRLWWLARPFVWRWRLGYWDWDASKVALCFAFLGRAPVLRPRK